MTPAGAAVAATGRHLSVSGKDFPLGDVPFSFGGRASPSPAKASPLSVHNPIYITEDFVGYGKIVGSHLYPTQITRLPNAAIQRVAEQLGEFLGTRRRRRWIA